MRDGYWQIFSRSGPGTECIIGRETEPSPLTSRRGRSMAMGAGADRTVGHWFARRLAIFFFALLSIFFLTPPASAQDTALMRRGDAAVTAFSGAKKIGAVPADLHPLDIKFIDVNGEKL